MRRWIRTLPAKVICFLLCVTGLMLTIVSVIGALLFAGQGFYNQTKEYRVETEIYSLFCSDAYKIIEQEAHIRNFNVAHTAFSADNTNLRFQLLNAEGEVIAQNVETKDAKDWDYYRYFEVTPAGDGFAGFQVQNSGTDYMPDAEYVYTVHAYLEEGLPKSDDYAWVVGACYVAFALRYAIFPIGILSFLVAVICFIVLMCISARRPDSKELHPGLLNRVPIDLLLGIVVAIYGCVISAGLSQNVSLYLLYFDFFINDAALLIELVALLLLALASLLGLCMSIAARMKQGTLLKNTVIWRLCKLPWYLVKWVGKALTKLPLVWRSIVVVTVFSVMEAIVLIIVWDTGRLAICWALEKMILIPAILYIALMLRKLQQGGEALAKGDFNYKVTTDRMLGNFKQHGENLNAIADSMTKAVEEGLHSERMKTELITNVSHDIKTPLTSIINYANLIGEETCDSSHHKEYADVLVRKSVHLKRLLDDLVEISKATSGNLEVVLAPCDAGVLLTQVAGEYEQRCREANLELITNQPEDAVQIMADSRRIWRVFENLMNNACKYSLAGSRVYLQLEQAGREAIFTFRNTSRTALQISPSELMERFVRGDASRSTEGNGLGLSIAKSLTELQNGKMDIAIDGDLFKVTIRFLVI